MFRYRLRTLLVIVTLLSLGLSVLSRYAFLAARQRTAVRTIESAGGTAYYSYDYDYEVNYPLSESEDELDRWPSWVEDVCGKDFLYSIVWVDCSCCNNLQIEHLNAISGLRQIKRLDLSFASVVDLKPIAQLYEIEELKLQGARLDEHGITSLGQHPHLRSLDVRYNELSPEDLRKIGRMRSLEFLGITVKSDDDLAYLVDLNELFALDLSESSITGQGLIHLNCQAKLCALTLRSTTVNDRAMEMAVRFKHLRSLDLSEANVTDIGMKHVDELENLELLLLSECDVSDDGLMSLVSLPRLQYLQLYGTNVSVEGIRRFLGNYGPLQPTVGHEDWNLGMLEMPTAKGQ